MTYLTSRTFWTSTAERAIKTLAQALIAALTIGQTAAAIGVDVLHIDWTTAISIATGATLLSVLTSIASGPIGPDNSPSLVGTDRTAAD